MICPGWARWAAAGAAESAASASVRPADAAAVRINFDIISPFNRVSARCPNGFPSNSFRKPDRDPTAGANRRAQQRERDRFGSAVGAGGRLMLQLLGAELGDVGGKHRIVRAKRLELFAIMAVDLGLDRI